MFAFIVLALYLVGLSCLAAPVYGFGIIFLGWQESPESMWKALAVVAAMGVLIFLPLLSSEILHQFAGLGAPSDSERRRLEESGALAVLEESGAKIEHVLISNDRALNALSLGSGTVGFTRGLLADDIRDDVLRAVAAHEAGHIRNGDTRRNRLFLALGITGKALLFIIGLASLALSAVVRLGKAHWILLVVALPLSLLFLAFVTVPALGARVALWLGNLAQMAAAREAEFAADAFAHHLGHGEGLKRFLRYASEVERQDPSARQGVMTLLLETHPSPKARLAALEGQNNQPPAPASAA